MLLKTNTFINQFQLILIMVEINNDNLEAALSRNSVPTLSPVPGDIAQAPQAQPAQSQVPAVQNPSVQTQAQPPQISKEEEIGIHKGALSTLSNERNELVKMIQNVEMVMQVHLRNLEELGVKINQTPQ